MKKVLIIIVIIVIIVIIGVLVYQKIQKAEEKEVVMPNILQNKKIAMIIAFRDFRDEEYFIPKKILEGTGAEITTVSNKSGIAVGADGGDVEVNLLLESLNPVDFDAIVFIGGPGCLGNLDNEESYRIIQETVSQNKVLASICISPVILAKAGVLEGKKATVWSSIMDKSAVKILKNSGVIYQSDSVVVDGKIVTADGPAAAKKFAEAIINLLTK